MEDGRRFCLLKFLIEILRRLDSLNKKLSISVPFLAENLVGRVILGKKLYEMMVSK